MTPPWATTSTSSPFGWAAAMRSTAACTRVAARPAAARRPAAGNRGARAARPRYGSPSRARTSSTVQPSHCAERQLAQLVARTVSGTSVPRSASSAVSTARRIRAHVGGAHAIAAAAPRPSASAWARPRAGQRDVGRGPGSGARRSTPTRRGGRAAASRRRSRPARVAQARQHFLAAEQRQDVEERRRGGPARHRQARELSQVDELEPERGDELAIESPRSPAP